MTEFLCLGGPLHGQVLDVPVPENGPRIEPPPSAFLMRKDGDPIPQAIQYVLRPLGVTTEDGRSKVVRSVMAVEQMQGQQVMMALADVLVTAWVREGDEIVEGSEADAEPGLRGPDGQGGNSGTGTGLIAP